MAESQEGDTVMLAAAMALESWASNQAMVVKVTTLLDIKVDGVAVAKELRARAASLREQAIAMPSDGGFQIAEMGLGHFSWVEQVEALDD
jgi:hypothetical protein